MRMLSVSFIFSLAASQALACAPSPSCWIDNDKAYLRGICSNYAKGHQTLKQIVQYLDEPEKLDDFVKACAKLRVSLGK